LAPYFTLHLAAELERRGSLERFITGFPKWHMTKPELRLGRLPSTGLVTLPISEYIWQIAKRWPAGRHFPRLHQRVAELGQQARFEVFGYMASRRLGTCNLVIMDGGGTGRLIKAARERGAVTVLLAGSTHARFRERLLREERERNGVAYRSSFSPQQTDELCAETEQYDYIDAASEFVRQSFLQEGIPPGRMKRHAYGTDTDYFRPGPKQDSVFRVLFPGLVGLRKGIQYLLPAFKKVARPGWELLVMGPIEGDARDLLVKYDGTFQYSPGVPMSALRDVYVNASVMVMPSIEEGLARVIPESMACGLPVIITPNSGGEEHVTDGVEGFVVPIRDVESLAGRIEQLGNDADMRAEMGRRARARIEQHDWRDYAREFVDTYEEIVRSRAS
jgi:glycosyltransferase involved in cell wall biosynthesis